MALDKFSRSQPVHKLLHRLFLLLDGFDEFELRAAAFEVAVFHSAQAFINAFLTASRSDGNTVPSRFSNRTDGSDPMA